MTKRLEHFFLNNILKTTSRVSKYKSQLFTAGIIKSIGFVIEIFLLQIWLFFLSFTTIFMKSASRKQLEDKRTIPSSEHKK